MPVGRSDAQSQAVKKARDSAIKWKGKLENENTALSYLMHSKPSLKSTFSPLIHEAKRRKFKAQKHALLLFVIRGHAEGTLVLEIDNRLIQNEDTCCGIIGMQVYNLSFKPLLTQLFAETEAGECQDKTIQAKLKDILRLQPARSNGKDNCDWVKAFTGSTRFELVKKPVLEAAAHAHAPVPAAIPAAAFAEQLPGHGEREAGCDVPWTVQVASPLPSLAMPPMCGAAASSSAISEACEPASAAPALAREATGASACCGTTAWSVEEHAIAAADVATSCAAGLEDLLGRPSPFSGDPFVDCWLLDGPTAAAAAQAAVLANEVPSDVMATDGGIVPAGAGAGAADQALRGVVALMGRAAYGSALPLGLSAGLRELIKPEVLAAGLGGVLLGSVGAMDAHGALLDRRIAAHERAPE